MDKLGVSDFKNLNHFCPGDRSHDTAHAQLPCYMYMCVMEILSN